MSVRIRRTFGPLFAVLLVLATACGGADLSEPPIALGYVDPDPGGGGGPSPCVVGGDDLSGDAVWDVDGCESLGSTGFLGQSFTTSLVDGTDSQFELFDQQVYFVHEVRWASNRQGYRVAAAKFYSGPVHTVVNVGGFDGTLLQGLEGVVFLGFMGGCGSEYSTPVACAEAAFNNLNSHDEPRLCIWNVLVGAAGSAHSFCNASPFGPVLVRDRLPQASFAFQADFPECPPGAEQCGYLVDVDATSSSSPRSSITVVDYTWICPGTTYSTSSPATTLFCITSVPNEIRLTVTDDLGGVSDTTKVVTWE